MASTNILFTNPRWFFIISVTILIMFNMIITRFYHQLPQLSALCCLLIALHLTVLRGVPSAETVMTTMGRIILPLVDIFHWTKATATNRHPKSTGNGHIASAPEELGFTLHIVSPSSSSTSLRDKYLSSPEGAGSPNSSQTSLSSASAATDQDPSTPDIKGILKPAPTRPQLVIDTYFPPDTSLGGSGEKQSNPAPAPKAVRFTEPDSGAVGAGADAVEASTKPKQGPLSKFCKGVKERKKQQSGSGEGEERPRKKDGDVIRLYKIIRERRKRRAEGGGNGSGSESKWDVKMTKKWGEGKLAKEISIDVHF